MKKIVAAVLGLSGLVLAGCFDIERTLALNKDLSGKAGFSFKVNAEPALVYTARMEGKTAAELDRERQEAAKMNAEPPDVKKLPMRLPKGVTLLDSSWKNEGLTTGSDFLFGFDHVSKLSQIDLRDPAAPQSPAIVQGSSLDFPFREIKVLDEGGTLLLTSPIESSIGELIRTEQMARSYSGGEKELEELFKGLRIAFKITAPFAVVEHNADRKEGDTLIWEYDLKKFENMKPEELAQGVKVRYKK